MRSFIIAVVLGLLVASAMVVSFPPYYFGLLAWVALIPFGYLCFSKGAAIEAVFAICGLLFRLVFHGPLRVNMMSSSALGVSGDFLPMWLAIGFLGGIQWWFASFCIRRLVRQLNWSMALALPMVWTSLDLISTVLPPILFGFAAADDSHLGMTQVNGSIVFQIADLGGVYLITFVVAAFNGGCVELVRWRLSKNCCKSFPIRSVVFAMTLTVTAFLYSESRLASDLPRKGPTVGLVRQSWDEFENEPRKVLSRSIRSQVANNQPDLIILGENIFRTYCRATFRDRIAGNVNAVTSIGISLRPDRVTIDGFQRIEALSNAIKLPLCCGTTLYVHPNEVKLKTMAYVRPYVGLVRLYHKINLSPHEITPNWFQEQFGVGRLRYTRGRLIPRFDIYAQSCKQWFVAAPGICYDSWIAGFYRQASRDSKPPDFFLFVSDETADYTGVQSLHCVQVAQLRAVESRRSLVRSVTNGISIVVDSCGRVLVSSRYKDPGMPVVVAEVPIDDRLSLYNRYGDVFAWSVFVATLISLGKSMVAKQSERQLHSLESEAKTNLC